MGYFKDLLNKTGLQVKQENKEQNKTRIKNELEEFFTNAMSGFGQAGFNSNNTFLVDIFDQEFLDPHIEMGYVRKAYFYNSLLSAAVDKLVRKLSGYDCYVERNKKRDKRGTRLFYDTLLSDVKNKVFEDLLISGNTYLQRIKVDGLERYVCLERPDRVFIDVDLKGEPKRYVYKTDNIYDPYHEITYFPGRAKSVRGVVLETSEITHLKIGTNTIPNYGRSPVGSAVNDVKALFEIEKAMGIDAKYKSVSRYLFNFKRANTQAKMDKYTSIFRNVMDKQNILLNEQEMPDVKELGFSQRSPNFEQLTRYYTHKIVTNVSSGYSSEGDVTNYSVADKQSSDEELFIKNLREVYTSFVDDVLNQLANFEVGVVFNDLDKEEEKQKKEQAFKDWTGEVLTLDEYREIIGLDLVGGELGSLRYSELKSVNGGFDEAS